MTVYRPVFVVTDDPSLGPPGPGCPLWRVFARVPNGSTLRYRRAFIDREKAEAIAALWRTIADSVLCDMRADWVPYGGPAVAF